MIYIYVTNPAVKSHYTRAVCHFTVYLFLFLKENDTTGLGRRGQEICHICLRMVFEKKTIPRECASWKTIFYLILE